MFTRRNFLANSGLLASALVLSGSTSSRSHAAGPHPRRVVIFLEGNGLRPACMFDPLTRETLEGIAGKPITSNRDYKHEDPVVLPGVPLSEARALGALASQPDQISLVERSALVLGLSATTLGGGHSTNFGALSAAKSVGGPAGPSIETVLAQIPEVRGTSPFDVIRVGVGASSTPLNYASCAFGAGKPAPILMKPDAVYRSLFGSVASGQASQDFANRKQLLEFAIEDTDRTLKGFSGSQVGRDKLATYEASLLAMLTRNEQIESMKDALLAVRPVGPGELDPDPYDSTEPLEQLRLQVDAVTAALLCGLTNVAVVSIGSGAYHWASQYESLKDFYPGQQVIAGHDLRHGEGAPYYEVLHELSSRCIGEMARMARALADTPETGGSMLDNTLLLYMSDNGEKHHSNAEEWAMLLVGGNNLGFKTDGRSVSYPKSGHANNRQTANMFNTLLHAAGLPTDDFGQALGQVAKGPLSELWG